MTDMPRKIYACPRGSGTVSGVWTDGCCMDEPETLYIRADLVPAVCESVLEKYQPCGCIVCTCENDERCLGCGSKNCGTHPVGDLPNPVYKPKEIK